ncbi:unnamed protein product [Paramecium pentaurelia]|uniref:Uncharacterized protein n=1 Tax=Paramecium pentaurelia TaxID=43138 RepID=A0A8S1T9J6_9CILI|nr:unnamed protein product [Paramecium pentaurelia]
MSDILLKIIKLSDKVQLQLKAHLKYGEKGVHPLQQQEYQKLQTLLKYQQ